MLIVDAQIHIWKGHKPTNANHRQIPDYTADDVLKEMDGGGVTAAVIHPPGWDPNSNALAVEAARQHPNRLSILAIFPLAKPESRSAIDAPTEASTGCGPPPSERTCRSRCSAQVSCRLSGPSPSAIPGSS